MACPPCAVPACAPSVSCLCALAVPDQPTTGGGACKPRAGRLLASDKPWALGYIGAGKGTG